MLLADPDDTIGSPLCEVLQVLTCGEYIVKWTDVEEPLLLDSTDSRTMIKLTDIEYLAYSNEVYE